MPGQRQNHHAFAFVCTNFGGKPHGYKSADKKLFRLHTDRERSLTFCEGEQHAGSVGR